MTAISLLVALPAVVMLGVGVISGRLANQQLGLLRQMAVALPLIALCASVVAGLTLIQSAVVNEIWLATEIPLALNLGIYFDSLSAVMFVLISFVGWIIARYSLRYLDGDTHQGQFLTSMLFTLGAVLLLVVSRNLVMFTLSWMLTSWGLHRLLTYYGDRPAACWAARKKFLISRLGDVLLILALVLTYRCFGTVDFHELFAQADAYRDGSLAKPFLASIIGILYVLGAMTKSAQFPFHSWLPDTMETPTPVSALMHAGIINAGGFLIIRLSPLVTLSPLAMDLVALGGAFTALFAGIVMLTQTSIKRSLAYSTIAQMGFMMLQCGLGAFSAALLHIVAHSLYKAHAFLSSGSVLDAAVGRQSGIISTKNQPPQWVYLVVAVGAAVTLVLCGGWLFSTSYWAKPGAAALAVVLTVALTHLLWQSLAAGTWRLTAHGLSWAAMITGLYFAGYRLMDGLLSHSISHQFVAASLLDTVVVGFVAIGFLAVFALQALANELSHLPLVQGLYVHAANGFYLDIPARRLTALIWGRSSPVL
jgi:NAD(P)H-quinone oxidoreductase subunit 5